MVMNLSDVTAIRKPAVYEVPKFEYETVTVDLQNIYSGDAQRDGAEAELLVKSYVAIQHQKALVNKKTIVAYYANLHPNIKICFLTFVLLDRDKVSLKRKFPSVIVPA